MIKIYDLDYDFNKEIVDAMFGDNISINNLSKSNSISSESNNSKYICKDTLPYFFREKIEHKIERLKEFNLSEKDLYEEVEEYKELLLEGFLQKGEYSGLYCSDFMEYRLEDLARREETFYGYYIFVDVNGLKSVGEFGKGFWGIKELINEISDILISGKTVNTLKNVGINVESYQEGGDEFGILLYSNKEISDKYLSFAVQGIAKEVSSINTDKYLDLNSEKLSKYFYSKGFNEFETNHIKFSLSFGYVGIETDAYSSSENTNLLKARKKLSLSAQRICNENKKSFKRFLANEGFLSTYHFYTLRAAQQANTR